MLCVRAPCVSPGAVRVLHMLDHGVHKVHADGGPLAE